MIDRASHVARLAVLTAAGLSTTLALTMLAASRRGARAPAPGATAFHAEVPAAPLPRVVAGPLETSREDRAAQPPIADERREFDDGVAITLAPRASVAGGRAPVTVVLHGMCGEARNICLPFAAAATARGWLVCPRAPTKCSGGGAMWLPSEKSSGVLDDVLARVVVAHPGASGMGARILVGFSLGASAALQVAEHAHGEWSALVLLSADVRPDASALLAAGVKSVLLAAGDQDMMRVTMQTAAARLSAQGMRARYMSLGAVGHTLAPDMPEWSERALAWVQAGDDTL